MICRTIINYKECFQIVNTDFGQVWVKCPYIGKKYSSFRDSFQPHYEPAVTDKHPESSHQ